MCSRCEKILVGYQITHEPRLCPFTQVLSYCSVCATSGHTTSECSDWKTLENRKPHFLEQLIPAHVLDMYGITSQTPLPNSEPNRPTHTVNHYVTDTEEHIRAELRCFGITPSQKKGKENKKRLEQYIKHDLGRRPIFVPPSN